VIDVPPALSVPVAPARMSGLRWHGRRDLRLDALAVPVPQIGECLIAVERVGICGTDLEEYELGPVALGTEAQRAAGGVPPVVLGHEVVGRVLHCPDGSLAPGTRVVPDVVLGCGACWWCARHQEAICPTQRVRGLQVDGGLAAFMIAEAATCIEVDEQVELDVAAFAEPAAVAVRAIAKAGDLRGATVLVIGAGVIGQLVLQVAQAQGAVGTLACDPVASRRKLAAAFGAEVCVPGDVVEAARRQTGGRGADVVLECSGAAEAVPNAVLASRPGGIVVLVGLGPGPVSLLLLPVILGERRLVGSAAHHWDEDVATAVAELAGGRIDPRPLLSAVVPLGRAVEDGFERLRADRDTLKILIDPTGAAS